MRTKQDHRGETSCWETETSVGLWLEYVPSWCFKPSQLHRVISGLSEDKRELSSCNRISGERKQTVGSWLEYVHF